MKVLCYVEISGRPGFRGSRLPGFTPYLLQLVLSNKTYIDYIVGCIY